VTQADIKLTGCAMSARVNAEDPWNHYLPSPGLLERFRIPSGANIRVDTYGCAGCQVPVQYDPLLAKVSVWGRDRAECVRRLQRALHEFAVRGVQTNLTLLQQIADDPAFVAGEYDTHTLLHLPPPTPLSLDAQSDLAVAAAVAFLIRNQAQDAAMPERLLTGWHRSSRAIA
jgi:acetyl/propionyl-CoA carboxylase alpha subunit